MNKETLHKEFIDFVEKAANMNYPPAEFACVLACFLTNMLLDTDHDKDQIKKVLKRGYKAGIEVHAEKNEYATQETKDAVIDILNILCKEGMLLVFNRETKQLLNAASACLNGNCVQLNLE